ncbi:unnamed protein product [Penicillium nalgiovense]|uniref:Calcineurin-like phosphoesterase domain-containing protein n=1 Tax=Penicillium nalgiovense TaxID=60175 RepID=A0A9W4MMP7_PENNA|nr:unnamed protein product [Penicillium nalgiovense]CAG8029839.1 unnamed protein product [Penicillium nalgiovense]CAG8040321.1 unnamed protein product [Penicillium nalgiovense]CAG8040559.1 unnamed protein product [Penicillium nalgiovense]CAG8074239.1 unnamed protein product [Penicillium nalgiovense]
MSIRRRTAYRRRAEDQRLRFNENGTFQISVFSDLHFAEGTMADLNYCFGILTVFKDDEEDNKTTGVMRSVLSSEEAQLVVLNGDLISGEATQSSNSSLYVDRVVAPLVDYDLPWASTYGNHDSELNLDPEEMFRRETQYRNSLTQRKVLDSAAGITNYYLPIFPHEVSNDSIPVFILWFFDSQGGHYPLTENNDGKAIERQNWVDDTVIEWFVRANANLTSTYGQTIPSLAFVHIPVHAMRAFQKTGVSPTSEPGINGERVQHQGYKPDSDYHYQDFPFINALLNTTGLAATFSGHDHDNDWCFKWDSKLPDSNMTGNGVSMCYGRHTGYGGYGEWARGGRQILLDERLRGDDIRTWIRMEDGSISGDVHLNATYGQDQYGLAERSIINGQNGGPSLCLGVIYLWIFVFSGLISGYHLW